jgi:GSCFA family
MDFRLEYTPQPFTDKIDITDHILLMGSCFTEHVYARLHRAKFRVLQNPNGVLFNPISIFNALNDYIHNKSVNGDLMFHHLGLWKNWSFHSSLAGNVKEETVSAMNQAISDGHAFIKKSKWLFITWGSAFTYALQDGMVVSNCHKQPAAMFVKSMLSPSTIIDSFSTFYTSLKKLNPAIRVILTISPVRHLREGFVENNRSKAVLHYSIDQITKELPDVLYFPAYELVVDDLRDYRFYAEDMVHPNYQSTRYVWEKLSAACLNGRTRELIRETELLSQALAHEVMHPASEEHMKFMTKFKNKTIELSERFPMLDFSAELAYFK